MKKITLVSHRLLALSALFLFYAVDIWARAGGGGGRSSSHSSSGGSSYHSSGGGYHSGSGYQSSGGGIYGGGSSDSGGAGLVIAVIIIIAIIILFLRARKSRADNPSAYAFSSPASAYPEGLDPKKVEASFREIQDAWQKKDLKDVRRWISDGVYQRYTAQFAMMNKLSQVNKLSNIQVRSIRLMKTAVDGNYHTADVAVSFSMDDSFVSDKYPQFNESFQGDEDTEYWTFIKRNDAKANKDLYSTTNCPNCGAALENQMGEISRCGNCGTLTNNAAYDWVLSEITQQEDYQGDDSMTRNAELHKLTVNDNLFSVQRIEDVASNIFMQIMEVLTGGKDKKLSRFADKHTVEKILQLKGQSSGLIFDRLYLNDVSLKDFTTDSEKLNLVFTLTATYQRILAGPTLRLLDNEMDSHPFTMVLSKNLKALQTPEKETVYSYECPACGAPYNDTTDESCTYCGEPVIDMDKKWVLTDFRMG